MTNCYGHPEPIPAIGGAGEGSKKSIDIETVITSKRSLRSNLINIPLNNKEILLLKPQNDTNEPLTIHQSQLTKKCAFTLAEVLITLGIIGVVAAMTLPTLIQKYQEKVSVNKLKKMYSVLSTAYNIYKIDNSHEMIPYTSEGATQVYEIFRPYLKVSKDCGYSGVGCIYSGTYKKLKGSGTLANYSSSNKYYKANLADGSSLVFRGGGDDGYSLEIFYDVNGVTPPNVWGKDMFEFDVLDNQLIPNGVGADSFERGCSAQNAEGWGCTAWVIYNENMDYLHCDDLSWNGKTKCK